MTDIPYAPAWGTPEAAGFAPCPAGDGAADDVSEGVTEGASGGVTAAAGPGATGPGAEGATSLGDRLLDGVSSWLAGAGDGGGEYRELPAGIAAAASWLCAAGASDILGGGPDGIADRIRHPRPAGMRSHLGGIVGCPHEPGNGNLAVFLAAVQIIVTAPVKIAGKCLTAVGEIGKRIDLAGDHPATVAVIAATAAAMIIAVTFT